MSDVTWQRAHAVDVEVDVDRAWRFMTHVANWADPPAESSLEGPFAEGTAGTTRMPGQPPLSWHIRRVEALRTYVIEMPLDRAALSFEWSFEAVDARRTRVSQRVTLAGENAAVYLGQVDAGFGANLQAGMRKIAASMERLPPD